MSIPDYAPGTVIRDKFNTFRPSTGAPFTLAGTPALSVYKDDSTTPSTAGVTLVVDVNSVAGFHAWKVDTSADGTFYSAGSTFAVVCTTGTVDGVSFVGAVVGRFDLNKQSALRPTTAGRTLDVSSGGEAGLDWANIGSPTTTVSLSGTTVLASVSGLATTLLRSNTAQSATSSTIVLDASASAVDDFYNGCFILAQGQMRQIIDYVGSSKTATIYVAGPPVQGAQWATTPSGGGLAFEVQGFAITPSAVSLDASGRVDVSKLAGQTVTAAAGVTFPTSVASPTNISAGVITTVSGDVGGSVGSVVGNVGGSVASVTGNVAGSVGSVLGNVAGSVGSVAGNVSGSVASVGAISTSGGYVFADVKRINAQTISGDGSVATPFKGNQ
jgi:hypothetical protein